MLPAKGLGRRAIPAAPAGQAAVRRSLSYYRSLGVAPSATAAAVKIADREAALRYHPDVNPEVAPEVFSRIVAAFDTLSCPAKRRDYDAKYGVNNHGSLYARGAAATAAELAALRQQEEALAAAAEAQRLDEARRAAAGGSFAKRRSRRRSSGSADGDWWDVPKMRGVHDAGYGFTANLESALYGQFRLDERWDQGTALPATSTGGSTRSGGGGGGGGGGNGAEIQQ